MGLDMYSMASTKDLANLTNEEKNQLAESDKRDIAYWRKVNWLHGFMQDKWVEADPTRNGQDFNCEYLEVTAPVIDELEQKMNAGVLKGREGFFWGDTRVHPDDVEDTRKWIAEARACFARGERVFYYSWW